jgi:hypothetical protein
MADTSNPADAEFTAMQTLYAALEPLDDDARNRVVSYIVARLEIAQQNVAKPSSTGATIANGGDEEAIIEKEEKTAPKYNSLAELYDATQPNSTADKALVAGYWLQVCQGAESFDGFSANRELKHLGQGLANITNAIESLKSQRPALALQLKKSGKSQQARKVYKITVAGIKSVEAMING